MKRLQEHDKGPREKKEVKPATVTQVAQTTVKNIITPVRRPPTARQQSEDDEIAKIKRDNKASGSAQISAAVEPERPATDRSSVVRKTPTVPEEVSQVSYPDIDDIEVSNLNMLFFLSLECL